MKHHPINRSRIIRRLVVLLMLAAASGCSTATVDPSAALDALSQVHHRLALHQQQQAALAEDLTTAIAELAAERLRLGLLLDIDGFAASEDDEDLAATIQRHLGEGSDNALVQEVRLGRLSLEEAVQIVRDSNTAHLLSPELQAAAMDRLISGFSAVKRLAATRQALIDGLSLQSQAAARLLHEAAQLTDAIRSTAEDQRRRTVTVGAAMREATSLIDDRELRESTRSLIDVLLPPPAGAANSTARSRHQ